MHNFEDGHQFQLTQLMTFTSKHFKLLNHPLVAYGHYLGLHFLWRCLYTFLQLGPAYTVGNTRTDKGLSV